MTKFKDFNELITTIYEEIKDQNNYLDKHSIPLSTKFHSQIAKKFNLITFNVPKLIDLLFDSHMIFKFDIVDEDRKKKIRHVEGYVAAEGPLLKKLITCYEHELEGLYTREFSEKAPMDKIYETVVPKIKEMNDTEIGKMGRIAIMLNHFLNIYEKEILKYSKKGQEKLLKENIKDYKLEDYISTGKVTEGKNNNKPELTKKAENTEKPKTVNGTAPKRRVVDQNNYQDFQTYAETNSIEKTIAVYGVEFYTRVCFRDYRFDLIQKIIDNDMVKRKGDLLKIKKMLQLQRQNSDQDLNLQNYASAINNLQRSINQKIKSME